MPPLPNESRSFATETARDVVKDMHSHAFLAFCAYFVGDKLTENEIAGCFCAAFFVGGFIWRLVRAKRRAKLKAPKLYVIKKW